MSNTVLMTLNRNFTVRSTLGHMLTFKKGEPLPVPLIMVRTCAEVGAARVDGADALTHEEDAVPMIQTADPGARMQDVRAALERIIERNDRDDFTAGGVPIVKNVSAEVG